MKLSNMNEETNCSIPCVRHLVIWHMLIIIDLSHSHLLHQNQYLLQSKLELKLLDIERIVSLK